VNNVTYSQNYVTLFHIKDRTFVQLMILSFILKIVTNDNDDSTSFLMTSGMVKILKSDNDEKY